MSDGNIFYVYLHYRKDTQTLFYVGKGKLNRKTDRCDRNQYWHRIVKKHGFYAELAYENLSEEDALKKEKELIQLFGRERHGGFLINMTDGGEGISGYRHTAESKKLISEASKRQIKTKEQCLAISKRMRNRNPEINEKTGRKLAELLLGKQRPKPGKNKYGFRGVSLVNGRFCAEVVHNRVKYYLGMSGTPEEAARKVDIKLIEIYGENAILNFPKENYIND